MKYLFVGGIADGQWLEMEHSDPEHKIPHYPRLPYPIEDPWQVPPIVWEKYVAERFRSAGKEWVIYRQDGLAKEKLFEKLLEGYRP